MSRFAIAAILLLTAGPAIAQIPAAVEPSRAVQDRIAGGDPMKRYFLIQHKRQNPPKEFGLLLVLPGGPGNAEFLPFCANVLTEYGVPNDVLAAELVAPVWNTNESVNLVWPGKALPSKFAKFTSEEFIDSVINDVSQQYKIHEGWIFTLGWSSSGHALYSASVENPKIRGSFIAMSRFQTNWLAHPENARGKRYYFWHSPDDRICPFAECQRAASFLSKMGASTIVKTYEGGHGWQPMTFYCDRLNEAIDWFRGNGAPPGQ